MNCDARMEEISPVLELPALSYRQTKKVKGGQSCLHLQQLGRLPVVLAL